MAVGAACDGHFSRPAWVTHSLLVMAYRTGKVFNYQSLQPTQMGLSLKVKNSIRLELVYRDGRLYKIFGVSGCSTTKPIDASFSFHLPIIENIFHEHLDDTELFLQDFMFRC